MKYIVAITYSIFATILTILFIPWVALCIMSNERLTFKEFRKYLKEMCLCGFDIL